MDTNDNEKENPPLPLALYQRGDECWIGQGQVDVTEEIVDDTEFDLLEAACLRVEGMLTEPSEGKVMHSGGAKGADYLFAQEAVKAGHQVIHYSFPGHYVHKPLGGPEEVRVLGVDELDMGRPDLKRAAGRRGCNFDKIGAHKVKYILRDWWQASSADGGSLYAMGHLDWLGSGDKWWAPGNATRVKDGTGWACQVFADRWIDANLITCQHGQRIPMYFYYLERKKWYQPVITQVIPRPLFIWDTLADGAQVPPMPTGNYCAIGSRILLGQDLVARVLKELYRRK